MRRTEALVVACLFAAGLALRWWVPENIGLTQFDEGVYALSGLGLSDPSQPRVLFPDQELFSPLVFPALIGASYRLSGGPSDWAAVLPNLVLGAISILAVWLAGRAWFGAPAGVAAAAMLAFSQYHIRFSRSALNDVAFTLFFLLALTAVAVTLQKKSYAWAVAAGLLTGLAWNTKYHGWFALAVAGIALIKPLAGWRRGESFPSREVRLWTLMAAVAVICYLPWALYVQSLPGGYLALAKYHRTMVNSQYAGNLWRQVQSQFYWEGPVSRMSVFAAFLCAMLVSPRRVRISRKALAALLLPGTLALLAGASAAAFVLAAASLARLVRMDTWPARLLTGWIVLWCASLPLYRPYPRLVLPLTAATYLASAWWMKEWARENEAERETRGWRPALLVLGLAVSAFLLGTQLPSSRPWSSGRGFALAAGAMSEFIPAGSRAVVIGEPVTSYYLHVGGRPAFAREERFAPLAEVEKTVYLVTGAYATSVPDYRQGMELMQRQLTLLGRFPVVPNEVRLLDDMTPRRAREYLARPDETYTLSLYRLRPRQEVE